MPNGWSSASDVVGIKEIDTGGQQAGNGGAGSSSGNIINAPKIDFSSFNKAEGADVHVSQHGSHDTASVSGDTTSYQTNFLAVDAHQSVMAGIGGNGGNGNLAKGGDVSVETANLNDVLNHSEHFHVSDFVHV
jgi:hypothetical protein